MCGRETPSFEIWQIAVSTDQGNTKDMAGHGKTTNLMINTVNQSPVSIFGRRSNYCNTTIIAIQITRGTQLVFISHSFEHFKVSPIPYLVNHH